MSDKAREFRKKWAETNNIPNIVSALNKMPILTDEQNDECMQAYADQEVKKAEQKIWDNYGLGYMGNNHGLAYEDSKEFKKHLNQQQ